MIFYRSHTAGRISWSAAGALPIRGLCHDHRQLEIESEDKAMREVLASNDVRTLIANQLGVDVKRVTDEAHFTDKLGAD
jgi:hypothetical protein